MDRRAMLTALCASGAASVALGTPAQAAHTTGHQLIAAFAATLSRHDIDAFAALFADSYVNHQVSAAAPPPPSNLTPKQASIAFFAARIKGLPDLKVTIEAQVENATMAAASFLYEGTQTAPYMGAAPTGKRLRFTSCDIFRVVNGQFAEHWGMGDIAGVMAQLKG